MYVSSNSYQDSTKISRLKVAKAVLFYVAVVLDLLLGKIQSILKFLVVCFCFPSDKIGGSQESANEKGEGGVQIGQVRLSRVAPDLS